MTGAGLGWVGAARTCVDEMRVSFCVTPSRWYLGTTSDRITNTTSISPIYTHLHLHPKPPVTSPPRTHALLIQRLFPQRDSASLWLCQGRVRAGNNNIDQCLDDKSKSTSSFYKNKTEILRYDARQVFIDSCPIFGRGYPWWIRDATDAFGHVETGVGDLDELIKSQPF